MGKELAVVERGITSEQYVTMVEELNALKTEQAFEFGVRHVQWAWQWGKIIRDYFPNQGKVNLGKNYGGPSLMKLVKRLSLDVGRSEYTLLDYVRLYDRHPDIEVALEAHGKSISVRKLIGETDHEATEEREQHRYLTSLIRNLDRFLSEDLSDAQRAAAHVVRNAAQKMLD